MTLPAPCPGGGTGGERGEEQGDSAGGLRARAHTARSLEARRGNRLTGTLAAVGGACLIRHSQRGRGGSSFWTILRRAQRLEGGGLGMARGCERAARGGAATASWQRFRKWGGPVREFRKLSELD